MHLGQTQDLHLKQSQKLIMSMEMKQSFEILEMPVHELGEWIKDQVMEHPFLEFDSSEGDNNSSESAEEPESKETVQEDSIYTGDLDLVESPEKEIEEKESLFEHLMRQARDTFEDLLSLEIAESIIGNLNEKGYLDTSLEEIAKDKGYELHHTQQVLFQVQSFDPPGIAACSLRESLLIQLSLKGKKDTLAYTIIKDHYPLLLKNQIPLLLKKLHCSSLELQKALKEDLSLLDFNPGKHFDTVPAASLIPDVIIDFVNGQWIIDINSDPIPKFHLSDDKITSYLNRAKEKDEKKYADKQLHMGSWLLKTLAMRGNTLRRITQVLISYQEEFLKGNISTLQPLSVKEVAQSLELHPSTISRAIHHKYLSCPQGIFPFRYFFSCAMETQAGCKIANKTIINVIEKIIHSEDKQYPLSDQEIADKISSMGFSCARRTVSKYRIQLNIPSAHQRRKWD